MATQQIDKILSHSELHLTAKITNDISVKGEFLSTQTNGIAYDCIMQAVLVWVRLYHGVACLPMSGDIFEVKKLPNEDLYLHVNEFSIVGNNVKCNCVVFTENGSIIMRNEARIVMNKELKY